MADANTNKLGFSLRGSGGLNPMQRVGDEGVRQGGYNIGGEAKVNIPIDKVIRDAVIRLMAGGFSYGGRVKLPQHIQEMGAPARIEYGDSALDNLGIGFTKGGFSADAKYNPQTNEKSIGARYKLDF